MMNLLRRSLPEGRREDGITTAEYAVGTAGGIGVASVLFKLFMSDWFQDWFKSLIENALGGFSF